MSEQGPSELGPEEAGAATDTEGPPGGAGAPTGTAASRGAWGALRRTLAITGVVVALEGALCAWFATPGSRLRLWVDFLTVQGIILAILGSFLLVGKPFVAARALGRWGRDPGGPSRGDRFRWGITMIVLGAALFGAANWIWSAAFRG